MDTSTTSTEDGSKKVLLEELTKEELLKKCRNLLTIAQRAKQARDALAEENAQLKLRAGGGAGSDLATQELIESFTQQKLSLVTSNDKLSHEKKLLEKQNAEFQAALSVAEEKVASMDTACQGYQRQAARLTEENEQLLTHFDGLEKQINELKRIGLEQQQQLLILEQNNEALANKSSETGNHNQVNELQEMLAISLEEVKKLQDENTELQRIVSQKEAEIITLNDTLTNCNLSVQHLDETKAQLLQKDEELTKQANVIDDLNTELHKNLALADKLKQDISNTSKRFNENQIESSGINAELQNHNEKLREKLKCYHSKIVKLAGDVRKVKESKEYILDTFKVYNQQVQQWKEQLTMLSGKLLHEMQTNTAERNGLQAKIQELEAQWVENGKGMVHSDKLQQLQGELIKMKNIMIENESLHKTVTVMRAQIANLETGNANYALQIAKLKEMKSSDVLDVQTILDEVRQQLATEKELVVKMKRQEKDAVKELEKFQSELDEKERSLKQYREELEVFKQRNASVETQEQLREELKNLQSVLDEKIKHHNELTIVRNSLENEKSTWCREKASLGEAMEQLQSTADREKSTWKAAKLQLEATVEGSTRLVSELKKAIERLESDAELSRVTESKLAEQTSETILQLHQDKKRLEDRNDDLRRQLEAAVDVQQSENAELLAEMNVMNQALKERGETISQQQAHCDELVKKIQAYETQLAKSQEHAQQLHDELQSLRSQASQQDECDALSTSTMSRCDEINRMKELEGSWEERYGKLRTYALKLKARAKELQEDVHRAEGERGELQGRLASSVKAVQSMQGQIDALQDRLDAQKEGKGQAEQMRKDNQRLLQQLGGCEETIRKLKQQVEALEQEKANLDAWKKQVGTKVQTLKRELEANAVMRKEFEGRIVKLQTDAAAKERELAAEREQHSATKSQLHESNSECKKQTVLNLEMQDYERSMKEMCAKLEKKNEQVTKLKNQIDAQKGALSATKEQRRLVDERCGELQTELDACRIEVRTFKKQIADLEMVIGERESHIEAVTERLEGTRSENEDLSTQLSKIIAEHQRANQQLRDEKDHFRSENVDLEGRVRQLEDQLKLRCEELANVSSEYQGYKVRAQSVLRQNQSRDVGVEEKLAEEAASLRAQTRICQGEIDDLKARLQSVEAASQKLSEERTQLEAARRDVQVELHTAHSDVDKLNAKHLQTVQAHNETVRSLKLHAETLAQCYRQQISEQEVRHNREIIELQSKCGKKPVSQADVPALVIPTTAREEGEGSESVDSSNGNALHPLEKLLGGDQEQELAAARRQLGENEARVVHLTALLADTEQDLSKHMQMNKVLKEEIRRQQRSVERERHAENLEYMKNVVFKFITLGSGDERLQLVPVLNTILKLSPEETNKLNTVARGDKPWSTYLPLWSGAGGSRPQ